MKKLLLLIPFLLLAGCGTETQAPVKEIESQPEMVKQTEEEKKDELQIYYMKDENAWFSVEQWDGEVALIPWFVTWDTVLKSSNMFTEDAVAGDYSKFLVVGYVLVNETSNPISYTSYDMPDVFDAKWRRYPVAVEYSNGFYVPNPINSITVKPWIPENWYVVYEVAKDSEWFYIQAWNIRIMLEERPEN